MSRDIPKTLPKFSASSFKASTNSAQKLSISNITQAPNTSTNESKTNTNDKGEVAKSTAEAAQAFSTRLPGTGLSDRIFGANTIKPPGSARSNINDTRNNANDMAAFQAMIKGSQETAKALGDGIARAFSAFGAIGQTAFMAAKKNGSGGEEAASGKQPSSQQQQSAQQQQSSQQQQQMYAQNDAQGQGGGGRA